MYEPHTPQDDLPAYVFDLDGTIWDVGHRIDWTNPATMAQHCQARQKVADRIIQLAMDGHPIAFLSARRGLHRGVTRRQISEILGHAIAASIGFSVEANVPCILMRHRPIGPIDIVLHKHDGLRALAERWELAGMCGDMAEDQSAAASAGVPFLSADDFAAGHPWPMHANDSASYALPAFGATHKQVRP